MSRWPLSLGFAAGVVVTGIAVATLGTGIHLPPSGSSSLLPVSSVGAVTMDGSSSVTNETLSVSASGSGVLIQEFSVPDDGSELALDITITVEDTDRDEVAYLRTTNDSDVAHHLLVVGFREGEVDTLTVGSSIGDVGGVYAGAAGVEEGAGVDGVSRLKFTEYRSTSSQGDDLRLAVLFVRSNAKIDTELTWTGEVGDTDQTTHGDDSVLSLDVDDLGGGVAADIRPGPSMAIDTASKIRGNEILGYFLPSQGPGHARYAYQGPDHGRQEGSVTGFSDRMIPFHEPQAGSWFFELEGVFAREDDPRPVVLAGDLQGGIEHVSHR